MDIVLALIAVVLLLVGLAGCLVPVIPGPPLSYAGLLILHFTGFGDFTSRFLFVMAAVTVAVTIADLYLPVWFMRRYGGSRAASIGAVLGVFAGLFLFPPLGIIVCPFLGAFLGELIHDGQSHTKALRVAMGAFMAFMAGTGLKLIVSGVILFYGIAAFFR
ncbi:MAG: DUF456 domain-containing protein [Alistipes sp.]|nr:DUF456 domain-containing protein [Alistipes sp.]